MNPELAEMPTELPTEMLAELEAVPVFDGPELACPACAGSLEQLELALDLEGISPASCRACGAVLAA